MASDKFVYKSIGKSGISYAREAVLGKGGFAIVYCGFLEDTHELAHEGQARQVAVKRIQLDLIEEHEVQLQRSLNHENVLKILKVEQDEDFRYIILELCAGTLTHFINKEYTGPMPSDTEVLYQIACGVHYIHSQKLVHRDINPYNILISCTDPVVMKLSDFGLSKSTSTQGTFTVSGIKGTKYWMAPELLLLPPANSDKVEVTTRGSVQSDIFATGCVFFYFIQRGTHPFGDQYSIEKNIVENNPVYLTRLQKEHFAYVLIEKMIKNKTEERIALTQIIETLEKHLRTTQAKVTETLENQLISKTPISTNSSLAQVKSITRPLTQISHRSSSPDKIVYESIGTSSITYARTVVLGKGGFTIVHRGLYNDTEVAVKKIPLDRIEEREVKLQYSLKHENVLNILFVEEDKDFRYIVLELCAATLEQFIKKEYTGPMPTDKQVLHQIACGVRYIHSMNLIHRDIKSDNILISCTDPVVMKVSDFGLSKPTSSRGTFVFSGIKGSENWLAPEILSLLRLNPTELNKQHGTVQSDIFALGCVFFYFIKRGTHPFGEDKYSIAENIRNGNAVNVTKLSNEHFAYGPIENMIKKLDKRIALAKVIEILETKTLKQNRKFQFKAIERSLLQLSGVCLSRFHPTEPVLACCGLNSSTVILLKGANGSIPFSNWRIEQEYKGQTHEGISELEWNVNGTQLAAGFGDGTVIVWSYPSGRVIFEEMKHSESVKLIAWNPFRQDVLCTRAVFATRQSNFPGDWKELLFWNSRRGNGDADKANHFLTLKRDEEIMSVAWISANQIAIGFWNNEIEIWEIDEDEGTSRVVKQFKHGEGGRHWRITDLQWNERNKYLASCSWDGCIKIWSMDSDQPVHILQVHDGCRNLAWRRNVKTENDEKIDVARSDKKNLTIACGLWDGSIVIWNPLEEDEAKRKRILLQKHSHWVDSLSFSPDGRFLASADYEGELIIIWSTETWLPLFTCKNNGLRLSWMSSNSFSIPANKLAVLSINKVRVIEESLTE